MMFTDYIDAFRAILEEAGLRTDTIIADGKLHRCGTVGKEHGSDGSYVLFSNLPISGRCWNYRTGEDVTWTTGETRAQTNEEVARTKILQQARRQVEKAQYIVAQKRAFQIMAASQPAPAGHPYLIRKGVKPHGGIRIHRDGRLVLPIYNALGALQSVQFLSGEEKNAFSPGERSGAASF